MNRSIAHQRAALKAAGFEIKQLVHVPSTAVHKTMVTDDGVWAIEAWRKSGDGIAFKHEGGRWKLIQ